MDNNDSLELLKISQASKLLKVHPNTLRIWDKKGILKSVRFGQRRDRRYRRADLYKLAETSDTT